MPSQINLSSLKQVDASLPGPTIGSIVIYPAKGCDDSDARFLSALAGYIKSLFKHFSPQARLEHIVFTNLKSRTPEIFQDQGIVIHECWRKNHPLYWIDILKAISKQPSIRVIHLQHEFNQFGRIFTIPFVPLLLALLRYMFRKRIVITFHEVLSPEQLDNEFLKNTGIPFSPGGARFMFRWYYRITSYFADVIFVQDESFMETMKRYGIVCPIQIARIGTDSTRYLPPKDVARRCLQISIDQKVMLFFGTLDWRKGLDVLLDALALLPRGEYRLIIAGGQPTRIRDTPKYQEWYARIVEKAGRFVSEVLLLGFVDEKKMGDIFASSDLVVLPYVVPQKVSAVLNLAASHEIPCIASHLLSGQADPRGLFDPTPAALSEKIVWGFKNLDLLRQLAIDFKHKYDWRLTAQCIEQVYQELIHR